VLCWLNHVRSSATTGHIVNRGAVRNDATTIGCYRWDNVAFGTLLYPILLHSTPRQAHSIVLSHGNALIFQCKFFLPTVKTRPSVRQYSSLLISKEDSRDLSSARFRPLSPTIGRFFSNSRQPIETSRLKKDRHEVSTTRVHQRRSGTHSDD
jgi:hypothetical protein